MRHLFIISCIAGLIAANSSWADDRTDMTALIDKAIKAMGGEAKVAGLKAGTWKGKLTLQGTTTLLQEGFVQGWDQYRVELELAAGGQKGLLVLNGDKGWSQNDGQVKDLPANVLNMTKASLYGLRLPQLLPDLKGKAFDLSPLGELNIGTQAAVGIRVVQKNHVDVNLFFDKAAGLPLKTELHTKDSDGKEYSLQFLFSNYKDIDGLKRWMKVDLEAANQQWTLELSDYQTKDKLEDDLFAKP